MDWVPHSCIHNDPQSAESHSKILWKPWCLPSSAQQKFHGPYGSLWISCILLNSHTKIPTKTNIIFGCWSSGNRGNWEFYRWCSHFKLHFLWVFPIFSHTFPSICPIEASIYRHFCRGFPGHVPPITVVVRIRPLLKASARPVSFQRRWVWWPLDGSWRRLLAALSHLHKTYPLVN